MAGYDAVYDGFSFQDNGLVITNLGHFQLAGRQNQIENRANRSGGVLVQSQFGTKPIFLDGYYNGLSAIDAQNMYDTLAQAMNRQQRVLKIPHAGSYRRYTATPQNVILQVPDGLNKLTFSIEFVVPDGYAISDTDTSLITSTITTGTTSLPISVLGTEKARPFITLTFTSLSGGTGATVTLRNGRDFIGLTFTRNFVAGDIVSIDSENFQVFINGVLTAPDGRMPTWEPGPGTIYYSDTFSARSVNIAGTYKVKTL